MRRSIWFQLGFVLASTGAALYLFGCGGGNSSLNSSSGTGGTTTSAPTMVSAGDAPATMSNVLAALVTVSAVTFTNSSGTTVQVLQSPRTIELTHLGGIRAPLELDQLPEGTYDSVAITVSAAQITYLNSSNQVVVASATIASPTSTTTLSPAFTLSSTSAVDLRFDFDLASSLSISGSTVTFTPQVSAVVALASGEATSERVLYVNGTVTAVNTSNNTITLTTADTQLSLTLNVNSSTVFDDNLTLAGLQVGTQLDTEAQLQSDGTLVALLIEAANGGATVASGNTVADGLVTGTTVNGSGEVTQFVMVARSGMGTQLLGQAVTVTVNTTTVFKDTDEATDAGLTSFSSTQDSIFPGSGVRVTGTLSGSASSGFALSATQVRPNAVDPFGLLSAVPVTSANGLTLAVLLDSRDPVATLGKISTLSVQTNANTIFDGASLTSANAASMMVGTPLTTRGFLALQGTTYTEFAANVHEENH